MPKILFETNNDTATGVLWRKDKNMKGGLVPVKGDPGICAAMVAMWMKASIRSGSKGVTRVSQIGTYHAMGIVQGAYEMGSLPGGHSMSALLEAQGLAVVKHENGTGCEPVKIAHSLANIKGYACLGLEGKEGQHLIGVRIHSEGYDFLEPSIGLVRCTSREEFTKFVQNVLTNCYADYLSGEWHLFQVG